ncbi:Membrane protein involved in the export of O-antigen and teichoic acid [Prevotella sp. ne3005]|uniref:oligosaccharide flippase family protein n=1 Tax=Prevotella sp. ne3005 TaxID=1761887 RepID=UPI0008BA5AA9|nr:oligosaccharide flippase family protein [Prevotella sp. ne3005]SEM54451.1 Membrane protein involved in the export of O-antigen and teichoic acid [Prevotella sp. ne3005]
MSKIKVNFIYNIALTLSTYIIHLIVFPYVSRVLGVELIGRIGFVDNVVTYFSLFSTLGIVVVGVREIAACGDDFKKRSEVFSGLLVLLIYATIFVIVLFLLAITIIPKFIENRTLLLIGMSQLFMSSLLLEWLYQGIENFRYITIRNIAVKLIYAALVIVFIQDREDYILYYILTISVVVINAIINLRQSRNYVKFVYKPGSWKVFLKPMISLGVYRVLVSMYTTFNVIYLGFVCSETEVGYYYTSIKLFTIFIGVISAFTTVIMPRMSSLLAEEKMDLFKINIKYSLDIIFAVAIPLIIYCISLAPEIIRILSGPGFEGAITPMRIVTINVLFVAMAQIWVIQILMPMKKDSVVLWGSIIGAIVGLTANILLVGRFGAIGSALVLILAEIAGDAYCFYYVIKVKIVEFPAKRMGLNLLFAIPFYPLCTISRQMVPNVFLSLVMTAVFFTFYFFILHKYILKEGYIHNYLESFFRKS